MQGQDHISKVKPCFRGQGKEAAMFSNIHYWKQNAMLAARGPNMLINALHVTNGRVAESVGRVSKLRLSVCPGLWNTQVRIQG